MPVALPKISADGAVSAVIGELIVGLLQAVHHAGLAGLLADAQVYEAGDGAVGGIGLDDLLKAADHDHVTIQLQ